MKVMRMISNAIFSGTSVTFASLPLWVFQMKQENEIFFLMKQISSDDARDTFAREVADSLG